MAIKKEKLEEIIKKSFLKLQLILLI